MRKCVFFLFIILDEQDKGRPPSKGTLQRKLREALSCAQWETLSLKDKGSIPYLCQEGARDRNAFATRSTTLGSSMKQKLSATRRTEQLL